MNMLLDHNVYWKANVIKVHYSVSLGTVKQCHLQRNFENSWKAAVDRMQISVTRYTPMNMWLTECKEFDYGKDAL